VYCAQAGNVVLGYHVDHVKPHKGNLALFYDPQNLQTLCTPHHNGSKRREERRGFATACDAQGRPLDPNHPWNTAHAATLPDTKASNE
jgi:hypothetical protein